MKSGFKQVYADWIGKTQAGFSSLFKRVLEVMSRSFLPAYCLAAFALLILDHSRWNLVLSSALEGTFLAPPAPLFGCVSQWVPYALLLPLMLILRWSQSVLDVRGVSGPRRWTLTVIAPLLFSALIWSLIGYQLEFLFFYLAFSCFLALLGAIEAIDSVDSAKKQWFRMPSRKALALLQYEADKYWRGLNILWGGAAAVALAALGSYVISGPPPVWNEILQPEALHRITETRVQTAFFLLIAFIPGIVWIVAFVVRRVNRIHRLIAELDLK